MALLDACNPDLLDRIPLSARNVLDVGCGTGATLAAYRARNQAVLLYGIEPDPGAAQIAASRLDHVLCGLLEPAVPPFGTTLFDCILLGDSLQRMADPWRALALLARQLTPGGLMLLCVPNLEHWSFTHAVLTGSWSYQEEGLMDRAHLRWFTLASMEDMLRRAGLACLDVSARIFDAPAAAAFTSKMAPALHALGLDPAEYLHRATPLQHVWRAMPEASVQPAMTVVSTMLEPVGGVSDVRVLQPLQALGREPGIVSHVIAPGETPQIKAEGPRIFIFHRPCLVEPSGIETVADLLAQDFVVICEFDDHPDHLPVLQRPDVVNFHAVHAIQTTTPALASVLAQRNPHVAVFPNAIDEARPARNFTDPNRLTLFFGGLNREQDWPDLMPALNAVLAEAGERLFVRVVSDHRFFTALATPHKHFTPLCDYRTYLDLLATSDISLMPLRDTAFNRCKSDLKHLEASAARVLSLASPVVYDSVIESGRNGLLFTDGDHLQSQLRAVLANPSWAQSLAEAARHETLATRSLAEQTLARRNWYRQLWQDRATLTASLYARVPALRQAVEHRKACQGAFSISK